VDRTLSRSQALSTQPHALQHMQPCRPDLRGRHTSAGPTHRHACLPSETRQPATAAPRSPPAEKPSPIRSSRPPSPSSSSALRMSPDSPGLRSSSSSRSSALPSLPAVQSAHFFYFAARSTCTCNVPPGSQLAAQPHLQVSTEQCRRSAKRKQAGLGRLRCWRRATDHAVSTGDMRLRDRCPPRGTPRGTMGPSSSSSSSCSAAAPASSSSSSSSSVETPPSSSGSSSSRALRRAARRHRLRCLPHRLRIDVCAPLCT
jgi:hypothetical protein